MIILFYALQADIRPMSDVMAYACFYEMLIETIALYGFLIVSTIRNWRRA